MTRTTMADAFNSRTLRVGDSVKDASGRRYGVEGIQRRGPSPANVVRLRHTAGTLIVAENDFGNYYMASRGAGTHRGAAQHAPR